MAIYHRNWDLPGRYPRGRGCVLREEHLAADAASKTRAQICSDLGSAHWAVAERCRSSSGAAAATPLLRPLARRFSRPSQPAAPDPVVRLLTEALPAALGPARDLAEPVITLTTTEAAAMLGLIWKGRFSRLDGGTIDLRSIRVASDGTAGSPPPPRVAALRRS